MDRSLAPENTSYKKKDFFFLQRTHKVTTVFLFLACLSSGAKEKQNEEGSAPPSLTPASTWSRSPVSKKPWTGEPQSLLFRFCSHPCLSRQPSALSWNSCKGHSSDPSGLSPWHLQSAFSSAVTWGPGSYLVSRSRSQRSAAAVAPMAGDWRGPGDPRVLPAGDTGQRALATPAQGRAPACVLPALSAFLLLVLSPPSILTPHWPLVAPL